jgi:hypothetical protein
VVDMLVQQQLLHQHCPMLHKMQLLWLVSQIDLGSLLWNPLMQWTSEGAHGSRNPGKVIKNLNAIAMDVKPVSLFPIQVWGCWTRCALHLAVTLRCLTRVVIIANSICGNEAMSLANGITLI